MYKIPNLTIHNTKDEPITNKDKYSFWQSLHITLCYLFEHKRYAGPFNNKNLITHLGLIIYKADSSSVKNAQSFPIATLKDLYNFLDL
ncbi:hypothetical protein BFJ66_g5750 [Fusarium oxysporum f. sp. cepae]|uniref:Uncharacterized protein n=1 Tax=Fusarium oxysporum f. sp. cepae TaxID=396571 RepID=A0A3L6NGB3_FUSOX|nr:hypothetical protein BFJ65_g10493 [Fusarium oxysporum f. sp. cepae]RKK43583.1 hypothetical protein BFJ67_g9558 [Fusarium oxysporum f. sp. cepae]RKK52156.1 hypothetical protein BFJ66_g5750 [Fusarium oxysporum f. sp. cepae]